MVVIFGKQSRDKEGKEKEKESGGKRKRRVEDGWGLWTQTALQANYQAAWRSRRSLSVGSGILNSSFFQLGHVNYSKTPFTHL